MKWIWKNRAAKIATRRWYLITVNEHFPQVLPMLIIPVLPYPCKTDCPLVSPACNPFNSVVWWWPRSQALGGTGHYCEDTGHHCGKINRLYSPDSLLRLPSPRPSCCQGLYQHINICTRFIDGTPHTALATLFSLPLRLAARSRRLL